MSLKLEDIEKGKEVRYNKISDLYNWVKMV